MSLSVFHGKYMAGTWQCGESPESIDVWRNCDVNMEHRQLRVVAGGDELVAIARTFVNLPMVSDSYPSQDRVTTWCGDHARFIVANLHLVAARHSNSIACVEKSYSFMQSYKCARCPNHFQIIRRFDTREQLDQFADMMRLADPMCRDCQNRQTVPVLARKE